MPTVAAPAEATTDAASAATSGADATDATDAADAVDVIRAAGPGATRTDRDASTERDVAATRAASAATASLDEAVFDLDPVDAAEPAHAELSAGQTASERPAAASRAVPETPAEAPTDPADLPELAPRDVGEGAVRVALDDDLAVEVRSDDGAVDVTLEGDEDAIRPLSDVGPELEEELARHGWDLRRFGSRRDRQAPTTQHHVGSAVVEEETPPDAPANRVLRRGKLVDTLA